MWYSSFAKCDHWEKLGRKCSVLFITIECESTVIPVKFSIKNASLNNFFNFSNKVSFFYHLLIYCTHLLDTVILYIPS